ncbi:MAG: DUF2065 domain-containing protein [Rhodospirillales bacterium]|nr:DUF2065 domain-containing protein [Rhodospirillales bacterium]
MDDLTVALGLVLVIEGILYALIPDKMKQMMLQVMAMPSGSIRTAGLVSAIIGVGIVWLIRG